MTEPVKINGRQWFYILKDRKPVPCKNLEAFLEQSSQEGCWCVALDHVDEVRISTRFLGLDQARRGPPILFATYASGSLGMAHHYRTWTEAEFGHKFILQLVRTVELLDANSASAQYALRQLERINNRTAK